MKYLIILFLSLIFLSNLAAQQKANIAVFELEGVGVSKQNLVSFTNQLRTSLHKTNRFIVLERSQMDEILKEQGFQLSGCTSTECAVEFGKLLNVKYIVLGNIDVVGNLVSINLRLVNIETGKIERMETENCYRCSIENIFTNTVPAAANKLAGIKVPRESQQQEQSYIKSTLGFEIDIIPYILNGYNASLWYGTNQIRIKLFTNKFDIPSFYLRDGFQDGTNEEYGIELDYLLENFFSGFYVYTSLEDWKQSIGHEDENVRADVETLRWGLGGGYIYKYYKNLYINILIGVAILAIGDTEIEVGSQTAFLDKGPFVMSFSFGWHF